MWAPKSASKMIQKCVFLLLLVVLVISGCGEKEKANEVIATYEGGEVKELEFEGFKGTMKLLDPNYAYYETDPNFNETLLNHYIAYQVISEKADADTLEKQQKVVDEEFNLFKQYVQSQVGNNNEWDNLLKELNTSEKEIKNYLKLSKIAGEVLGKDINDQQLQAEYERMKAEDRHAFDLVSVSHILIATDMESETNKEARSKEEALEIAEEIKDKLDQGEDFAELAKEYSDDPGSAQSGGTIPETQVNQLAQLSTEFKQAAVDLPVGQVSEPIEADYGFHIMKVNSRRTLEFSEAKEALRSEMVSKQLEDFIETKLPDYNIQIDLSDE